MSGTWCRPRFRAGLGFGRQIRATTGSSTTTYEWDALGKLTRIAAPGTTATYAYGIDGTRSLKTVTTASGTKTTKQLWSGVRLLAELDSDGTRYDYLYAPDGAPLELRVRSGVKNDTDAYAYQVDAGGSVIGITDSAGTEVARYAYDPYGNPLAVEGTGSLAERNPLRYRGYCLDAESGYYHMPARYYDPASARFVSVDPAAPSAGDPVGLNGYSYCFGDPVGLVDPDGRDVLYGEYYSDEQDPTGKLDANLPDHDGAGAGKPPSRKVWEANNTPGAIEKAMGERQRDGSIDSRRGPAIDLRCLVPTKPDRIDILFDQIGAGIEAVEGAAIVAEVVFLTPVAGSAAAVGTFVFFEGVETLTDYVALGRDVYLISKGQKSLGDGLIDVADIASASVWGENLLQVTLTNRLMLRYLPAQPLYPN